MDDALRELHGHSGTVFFIAALHILHLLLEGSALFGGAMLAGRTVGGNQLGDHASGAFFVAVVGNFHQLLELAQESVGVEGNGLTDVNEVIGGGAQAFFTHELFFIELFAGAQAGVGDLNIHIGSQTGQTDQISGQGVDLHRGTHIQNEDLTAVGVGTCLKHQGSSLGDGHEVADDVGMGDSDGAAPGDLVLEPGDDRAVTAQHIAESNCHKFRGGRCDLANHAAHAAVGILGVDMERGEFIGASIPDLPVKGLDDHFAQTLGSTHDVGGIHGLVRGNQHKAFAAVHHGGVGRLVGADGVVLDGLTGAGLHEGDMLVGRGVVDDLGTILGENLIDPAAVADGADEGHQIQLGEFVLEFQGDVVGIVFVDVENDELPGLLGGDLTAQLTADGAAAAGDHDDLTGEEGIDLVHVDLHRLTAQQILHGHILHGGSGDGAVHELVNAGEVLQLTAGGFADLQNVTALGGAGTGEGQIDLLDLVFFHIQQNVFPAAHNGDAFDITAPLVGVVINDAADPVIDLGGAVQIPEDHLTSGTGANQHDPMVRDFLLQQAVLASFQQNKTVGKPHGQHQEELDSGADDVIGNRHPPQEQGDGHRMENRGDGRGHGHSGHFTEAGEPPNAPIQPQIPEGGQGNHGIEGDEEQPGIQIVIWDHGKLAVKAQPKREEIGTVGGEKIIDHQIKGDDVPVFQRKGPLLQARGLCLFVFQYITLRKENRIMIGVYGYLKTHNSTLY